jgi:DNA-binding CsgD family transcriptional regulator
MPRLYSQSLHRHLEQLQESQFHSTGSFYACDTEGTYLACNQTQLDWIGLKQPDDLVGRATADTPWEEYSNQFHQHNQRVLAGKQAEQFFEYALTPEDDLIFAISHKEPLYIQDKLIGIQGRSIRLPLKQLNPNHPFSDNTVFVDTQTNKLIPISQRRRESLYLLLKGLSMKEIAQRRNLSNRTIEHHIEHIREQNGYTSIRDILLRVLAI